MKSITDGLAFALSIIMHRPCYSDEKFALRCADPRDGNNWLEPMSTEELARLLKH